jgi:maltose alpha-D-glucosyltransferase/alpha-amylase
MDAVPHIATGQIGASAPAEDPSWFKDAIIYQLHVKAFCDSNSDGIGDFAGLASRLDYLQDLGVTAIWLLPFYPSPGRDDGYDIADYDAINPDFGDLRQFRRFVQEAKRRGLRVITELVINHTSDQHRWFQRARLAKPGSEARNWYVWSDDPGKYAGTRIIFSDTETSNWAWDKEARSYYWHRFFSHQPDLNFDNPKVLEALLKVMRRWLDLGVDGFRLDAIPYLCEREGTSNENLPATHAIIKKIRAEIDRWRPDGLLLAEANQWPEDVSAYFGDGEGDECHMAYHFPLMPRIFMAIAQEDRFPITDILRQTPEIPKNCQWALFLRNHDELTLEMVTDVERDYLWSTYATDPRARLNLGIRRRLAPLMQNDRRKIELMNALLLSFPGTPIIYYGDEIGMGDNIYLGDRNGVRTPMQWTSDRNGGFSRCDPARLYLPMIMDPVYGYEAVNVEAQSRSIGSLLSWMKRLIRVRRSTPAFGRGSLTFLRPSNRSILAYIREHEGAVYFCVANLSRSAQAAEIDLSPWQGRIPVELLGRTEFPPVGDHPYVVTVAPYGFFWFQLCDQIVSENKAPGIIPEFETLVLRSDWRSLENGYVRNSFEKAVLPSFLASRRWFAGQRRNTQAELQSIIPLASDELKAGIALVAAGEGDKTGRYALPLTVRWKRFAELTEELPVAMAAVRRGHREGALLDAAADSTFVKEILRRVAEETTVEFPGGRIEFRQTNAHANHPDTTAHEVKGIQTEQSNSTAIVGTNCVVKVFRRIEQGINPEVEIGRFLTDVAPFREIPPLLGWVDLVESERRSTLAVVHGFVENQGDLWTVTNAYLDRYVEEVRLLRSPEKGESAEKVAYLRLAAQIGMRLADLQMALSSRSDLADFAPEVITAGDIENWVKRVQRRAKQALSELHANRKTVPESDGKLIEILLDHSGTIDQRIADLLPPNLGISKIRHHGDLHLGQLLAVKDDVVILDFEGEPRLSLAERRNKAPAARDIAGIVRSIDYSATAAGQRALAARPDDESRISSAVMMWRDEATAAFISSYHRTLRAEGLWPEDQEHARRLLDFFLLEKAFYEICYELAHRPHWLRVPLAGTVRILSSEEALIS